MHHKADARGDAGQKAGLKSSWSVHEAENATIIECESCQNLGLGQLDYSEAEALLCSGSISRFCPRCGETTKWRQIDIHSKAGKPKGKSVDIVEALPSPI